MRTLQRVLLVVAGIGIAATVTAGLGGFHRTSRDDAGDSVATRDQLAFKYHVGECLDGLEPGSVDIDKSRKVSCSENHVFEVYFNEVIPDMKPFDQQAVMDRSQSLCVSAFEKFIGLAYDESKLEVMELYPSEETWNNGDNDITCFVSLAKQAPMTGTLRNAGI